MWRPLCYLFLVFLTGLSAPAPVQAAHAYAQFGDIKYPAGFRHFDWVDPEAPKEGEIRLVAPTRVTQYDKFNPFTLKGTSPPGLSRLLFESLLTGTLDEPTTAYGLLADDIQVARDKLSATFHLNPAARFHNGKPVEAADVVHSFRMLTSKQAHPGYANLFADVKDARALDSRRVRFEFVRASAELPLIVGSLPVFSRDWGAGKPFDQIVMEPPIASGPYRIGRQSFGRDISYDRDPDYWAKDIPVRRGQFNFDRVTYRIYKDNTAQTEAFKAGEFDYVEVFSAREWARVFTGRQFDNGNLVRSKLPARNAGDFQGYLINARRPHLADARVREAIGLAMDFEWLNRQFFYNSYTRVRGYFNGSDFEAKGLPGADELALLEPLRKQLRPEVFTRPVPMPPTTEPPDSLRANLRRARDLLAEAGWTYRDGALRNARGEVFRIEFLDSEGGQSRVVTPYMQALAKLGIQCDYRQVDFALLQKRLDVFDFDITSIRLLGSEAPGAELLDRFGSKAADTEGSGNLMGIRSPAVDALLQKAISATTRPALIASLRALDRVLRHEHHFVPAWYADGFRIAWRGKRFAQPATAPDYFQAEDWVLRTWWSLPAGN
ncbi:MAG: ABC transporter substrate-binding protein [Candidatus Dactylopiibacterium carminicum]|uniref:ABC transporter substrate-binding protein n=1 Tax=Candidatus Dactylopiibacterium carminicum TaxID=857335 RepID=A0A272ETL9_9RHOO|nr:extracellular solute-binding protein [Candidatus Dactylopiibacterium carminicum]KAF7599049.1 ABC transporter substrate-binding protein [Candidatus Dactylopiibacterium carminicum]PAS93100.1 MAG: ABC transporter substrate-binding protein [Candidatus Dactylopiibacterium carminicum]PAS96665.1 MAG: ABC transporter substrate-binding protein [Candidatus Dactylopiibacterium carminicum]PAS99061.1 MAG: ABC transporter substrate-binding protein [Candidatus Dactylopiibacterium carminicum]